MLSRVSPRTPLAAFAAAVALAVGCGGDDGSASSPAGSTEKPAATSPAAGRDPGATAAQRGVRLRRVGRFASPVHVAAPSGDPSRLFVVERGGTIRVLLDGRKLSRPFLDIRGDVSAGGERGLLSVAFARDYASSRRFYVYFTDNNGDIRIQEYRRSTDDANVADRFSGRNLLTIKHREFPNHNGGQLQIGPDGFLYAGTGDGGGGGDPHRHAQNLGSRLGKLLRIDPTPGSGRPYRVPSSNPFRGRRGARPEIWAYGLRNPWRFSFDRRTGALAIADVGQNEFEEIDFAPRGGRGANYGWDAFEGRSRFDGGLRGGRHMRPLVVHSHDKGWCSITGGYVVRDRSLGALYGRYVYGDVCKPGLRSVRLTRGRARGNRPVSGVKVRNLVSFGEDSRGRVYAVSLNGPVFRLTAR
jgi:glucose/arabinose dehydrogenase